MLKEADLLTVWEAIKTRRSIRKFAADNVSDEVIEQLLEAARLAPSGGNRQPWRFLVVRDEGHKKEISRICRQQPFIQKAPVLILCFGDLKRYSPEVIKQAHQELVAAKALADEALTAERISPGVLTPNFPQTETLSSVKANVYIAAQNMVLMATAIGLVTCWIGANDNQINHLFGLSDNLVPVVAIAVGYPATENPPQRPRLSREEILIKL